MGSEMCIRDRNVVVKKNAQMVSSELPLRSKIIADAVAAGKLKIVSAYYELGSGKVTFLD